MRSQLHEDSRVERVRVHGVGLAILVFAVAVAAASVAAGASAEDLAEDVWVTGTGRVIIGDRDLHSAREDALARARRDAVLNASGQEWVRSRDMLYQSESPEGYRELFTRLISIEASGLIVAEEPPEYRFEQVASGVLEVICTLRARVAPGVADDDPAFRVTVDLADHAMSVFHHGQEIILRVSATRDCYVTVFGMTAEGQVTVLYPNALMPARRLTAGDVLVIPDEKQREVEHIRYRVELPEGRETVQESIHVVATRDEVPFLATETTGKGGGRIETFQAAYTALNRWLVEIPAAERASATVVYTVVRR